MATGNVYDYAMVETDLTLMVLDEYGYYEEWQTIRASNTGEALEMVFETSLPVNSQYRVVEGDTLPGYSCSVLDGEGVTTTDSEAITVMVKCHSQFYDGALSSIWPRSIAPSTKIKLSGSGLANATVTINGESVAIFDQTENGIYLLAPDLQNGTHILDLQLAAAGESEQYSLVYNAIQVSSFGGGIYSKCAILESGSIACWGQGRAGQFPLPEPETVQNYSAAVEVINEGSVTALSSGYSWHSCFIDAQEMVSCFGPGYGRYVLPDGSAVPIDQVNGQYVLGLDEDPVIVAGTEGAVKVETSMAIDASDATLFHMKSCAVMPEGSVKCWSQPYLNTQYYSMNRYYLSSATPAVPLENNVLAEPVHTLAGFEQVIDLRMGYGSDNLCALRSDGQIQCQGTNEFGQLGDGTITDSMTPVFVSGINTAVSLSFNGLSACAVLADGSAKCWGKNNVGDFLEIGALDYSSLPVTIASQSGLVGSIALGATQDINEYYGSITYKAFESNPVCAATNAGNISCWGGTLDEHWWAEVSQLTDIVDVTKAGQHGYCFLKNSGAVNCSSLNRHSLGVEYNTFWENFDAIGRAYYYNSPMAVTVPGISDVKKVVMLSPPSPIAGHVTYSYKTICALTELGEVSCWGTGLSKDDLSLPVAPVKVPGLSGIIDISTQLKYLVNEFGISYIASYDLIALDDQGIVYNWNGQTLTQIAAGATQLGSKGDCFITAASNVSCLDSATGAERSIANTENAVQIGGRCILTSEGYVRCWAANGSEALELNNVGAWGATYNFDKIENGCGLTDTGVVKCWDYSESSGAPFFSTNNGTRSKELSGLMDIVKLADAFDEQVVCGIKDTGEMACLANDGTGYGTYNHVGQYGTNLPVDGRVGGIPVIVESGVKAGTLKSIIQHTDNMCAILNDGTLQCWGGNVNGSFGEAPTHGKSYVEQPIMAHPVYLGLQVPDGAPDTIAPFIAMLGDTFVPVMLNTGYIDQGAVAFDDIDGRVSVTSVNNVDVSVSGNYKVTYTATDAAGNTRNAIRMVTVSSEYALGSGNAVESGLVLRIDNSDPEVQVVNHNILVTSGSNYAKGNAFLTTSYYKPVPPAGSYIQYNLDALPDALAVYEIKMNTNSGATQCDGSSYQVLNENGVITNSFIVNHSGASILIGEAVLKKGYAVRINADTSACSATNQTIIDELELTMTSEFESTISCEVAPEVSAPQLCLEGSSTIVINEGQSFIDPGVVAIDSADGFVTVTSTSDVDVREPGTYVIAYASTDSEGNTTTTSRTVVVLDTTAPEITIHGESMLTLVEGEAYLDLGASAIDNADGFLDVTVTNNVNHLVPGWYSVDYVVSDAAGNTSIASRSVTVTWASGVGDAEGLVLQIDNSDPGFSANGHREGYSSQANPDMVNGNTATFFFYYLLGTFPESYFQYELDGLPASLGMYEITMNTSIETTHCQRVVYEVLDPNEKVTDSFLVDHSGGALTHHQSLYVGQAVMQQGYKVRINTGASDCSATSYRAWVDQLELRGIGESEVREAPFSGVLKIDNSDSAFVGGGEYLNSFCVNASCSQMSAGNGSTQYRDYILNALPEEPHYYDIKMSTYVTVQGSCWNMSYQVLNENQNVLNTFEVKQNMTNGSYATLDIGTAVLKKGYSVRFDAATSYTAAGSCTGWVDELELIQTYTDNIAPLITLIGAETISFEVGSVFTDPGATVTDNKDQSVSVVSSHNVDISIIGSYTVTYSSTDVSGNTATRTRTVNVIPDTTLPIISLVGDATITIDEGQAFVDPGATANDPNFGEVSVTSVSNLDNRVQGTYIITYNAVDASGNEALTLTRTVVVIADSTAPILSLNGGSSVWLNVGESYSDLGATAIDAFDGVVSVSSSNDVNTALEGAYTVNYSASDAASNSVTASRRVVVLSPTSSGVSLKIDNSAPEVTSFGHTQTNVSNTSYGAVNNNYATISTIYGASSLNSYYVYDLAGLPEQPAVYDIKMNTVLGNNYLTHCEGLAYQVLDANQQLIETFLVNHQVTSVYGSVSVGTTILKKGDSIRIDTASSVCSMNRVIAVVDELELVAH